LLQLAVKNFGYEPDSFTFFRWDNPTYFVAYFSALVGENMKTPT